MDSQSRLSELSRDMELEPAEDFGCRRITKRQQEAITVSSAMLPNGKRITMLKTLLTSACERNCNYCPFRSGRDFRRVNLSPDELADIFIKMVGAGVVQGLFLSSGLVAGGIHTQDNLIATADILRKRYKFRGYLHLKIMPGAEYAQVERSMQLADRLSINLEAPNSKRLERLAPRKIFMNELMKPLQWVEEIRNKQSSRNSWNGRWPSTTTQFVVGAVGETDQELLTTTRYLFANLQLSRAYFSAFRPVTDTPFENLLPASAERQNRLYQASFLLRDYGFSLDEIYMDEMGNLPVQVDPKTAWAKNHLLGNPTEINKANYRELIHVPGIGPKGAKKIIANRRNKQFRFLEDLRKIGVNPTRAIPYILLDGKRPDYQLSLF